MQHRPRSPHSSSVLRSARGCSRASPAAPHARCACTPPSSSGRNFKAKGGKRRWLHASRSLKGSQGLKLCIQAVLILLILFIAVFCEVDALVEGPETLCSGRSGGRAARPEPPDACRPQGHEERLWAFYQRVHFTKDRPQHQVRCPKTQNNYSPKRTLARRRSRWRDRQP